MPPLDLTPGEATLAKRPPSALVPQITLDEAPAAVYLAKLAKSGRRTQLQALTRIAALFGFADPLSAPWHRLRYQHTAAVRTALAEAYAPATANKMISALRGVLKECWRLGLMTNEEAERAADIKTVKGERAPKGRALTAAELGALLGACAADATLAGLRDAAIIAVMAQGGPRRSETAALTLEGYDRAAGALTIRSGKGNKDRVVYVTGGARTILEDWLTVRGDAPGALFPSLRSASRAAMTDQAILVILEKRAKEAGVQAFSPHDLRRTMITTLLAHGADVISVQRLAGHASPATTMRYDRRGEDAKKAAAEKFDLPLIRNTARRTLPLDE